MNNKTSLANQIHKHMCHWNHMDECGWDYESWNKPGYSRNIYLEKAERVLEEVSYETAMKVLELIK